MDPIDSGQGQEKPSDQCCDLSPRSKGRQRRKNPKYLNYETDGMFDEQNSEPKPGRRSGRRGAASKKTEEEPDEDAQETPKKAGRAKKTPTKRTPARKTPAKKTPAKKTPAKKTPAKKTPAKKTPTPDGELPAGEDGVVVAVTQENGTPKPKRQYVRRRPLKVEEPVPEPPEEAPAEPEEETTPGGRRRRGAAKAALKYLHILAKEVFSHAGDESGSQAEDNSEISRTDGDSVTKRKSLKGGKGHKGRKRKRCQSDSDAAEDEDFVPDAEEEEELEEMEDEEEGEEEDFDLKTSGRGPASFHVNRTYQAGSHVRTPNGLNVSVMKVVWEATDTTKKFREEHYSSWVFPEWVPSTSAWTLVPQSDLEKYLPQELQSAAFRVSREGLSKEETPLQRLSRFTAVPAHPDRWDMLLYTGGPIWSMEWCPTPDGAPASQYVALACHRGMDDQHYANKTYSGAGLVQLWDLSTLEYNSRPDSQPALAYGLAQDKGFIWQLKWCPAGGWELPTSGRKAPFLPRLGLLAVATSTGVVTIYSLPHPDALQLHSNKKQTNSGKDSQQLPIYKANGVLTLKLGSFKAPRHERSGQVLSMDWLPEKPHNIMAIGFYDGNVGLWDLSTKSALLRVREPDGSLSLLPYRCLLAHDHGVRALSFCPASRHLLVTAGEDRYVKTWDLRRPYDPITVQKRYLTNEIYWPLNAPGLMLAQENAYSAYGSQGLHYFDHYMRAIFAIPRTGTLWSISYTDWMNCVVTADCFGEVIFSLLPQIGYAPQYVKRTLERRFPIYLTSLVPNDTAEDVNQEVGGGGEENGDGAEEQQEGETEGPDGGSEGGTEIDNESGGDRGRATKDKSPPVRFQTYREAVKKYTIHHTDSDLRTFAGSEKRALWKRMRATEMKTKLNLDDLPLAALHKIRFNPNMRCHTWLVCGGQTGLVRLICLRTMISSHAQKIISEHQEQFNELYSPKEQQEAVRTVTDQL
ncbi:general transcription factor 3C polypeptide 2 [Centropristis striata]|uniref:general transcription factor 3C polypeptide 2 n=1 Tax=Centropristis striata TaxID=184440 RepID=UPI0027E1C0D7|nr:general transcription factor 3C polypeptide 2 [Centropristis striata]XP_059213003.1 general transcription factor 3C polypeptide 2 [Centropristis striata]XP_059213004.1 general transcription factor 3C polypeptide 2 [Centropristis striata]XP_059213005.1 general transcription factor 3C polypeptide 2 [Centropristis striata]